MSSEKYYQVVIGALLHDIGKPLQRLNAHDKNYQTNHSYEGENIIKEIFRGSNFFNTLSTFIGICHNKKYKEKSENPVFNSIIAGDEISAAERERREEKEDAAKIPLIPISARVKIKLHDSDEDFLGLPDDEEFKYGYVDIFEERFPVPQKIDNNTSKHLDKQVYENICNVIREDFSKLSIIYKNKLEVSFRNKEIDVSVFENFVVSLLSVLQRHTSYIPSAAYLDEADISLYDHSRVAAAVAGCLIQECDKDKPFLYLAGDLSGIQDFIYKIVAHDSSAHENFSKRLRGRSFYISLLTDGIARYILRSLKLSEPHLLLSGGGNFNILLPNSKFIREELDKVIKEVKTFLFDEFQGQIGIVTATVEANDNQLMNHFDSLLYELNEKLNENKRKKLNDINDKVNLVFDNKDAQDICPSCGNDVPKKDEICDMCKTHQEIGGILPKAKYLYFVMGKTDINENNDSISVNFGELFTWILSKDEIKNIPKHSIRYLIDIPDKETINFLPNDGSPEIAYSYKWVGKYLPRDGENVMTFENIAKKSKGAEYLGVVRMDVDNMGAIFALGFSRDKKTNSQSDNEKKRLTSISRYAQLSRQLDTFFSGYLVHLIKTKYDTVYLGYSGGDDLFFVAPWNTAIDLAKDISNEFKKYMCNNPVFHLSGGMVITKPKYPVAKSSLLAGSKEESAKKESKWNGENIKIEDRKNRFSVFNRILKWDELEQARKIKELLEENIENEDGNKGKISLIVPYRLLQLLKMHTIVERGEDDIIIKKYHPALFSRVRLYLYRVVRDSDRDENTRMNVATQIADEILNIIQKKGGKGIEIIEVALNWCALEMRKK